MEFRKFMLDDYLNGKEGQSCWDFFAHFKQRFENRSRELTFYDFVTARVNGEGYGRQAFERLPIFEVDSGCFEKFDDFYEDMHESVGSQDEAREMQNWIPYFSVELYIRYPEYAVPYLIPRHFYKMEIICREFGIKLPRIPSKNDHVARFNYYFDLCRALYDFRRRCEMSPTELCVFLYGYAMRFVDDIIQNRVLRNNMVFLLYAGPEDRETFLSHDLDPNEITVWQGRPEMMPGDIALMYERAPRSCFSSVWRVVTPGFDDPFDAISGKVFIGEHVDVPPVPFSVFSKDPVWSKNPLVDAHMQNGACRACSVAEYKALVGMIRQRDPNFDIAQLPPAPGDEDFAQEGLAVEHDVEVKLLEPLLRQLGFSQDDWVSQFIVRIGRENTSRPDYVVYLDENGSTPTARYVFEAKLTVPTKRQLRKDHGQVATYGNLLQSEAVALVAREGVWFSRREDRFDFEKLLFYSWDKVREAEPLAELRAIFKVK